jgi:hypothetical protein
VNIKVTPETATVTPTYLENFKGTATDKTFTDSEMNSYDYYALSGGKAFAKVKGVGTLGANQCWLEFAKSSGARQINLVFEDSKATGIDASLMNSEERIVNGAVYDLCGRKLQGCPTQKGVYIQNGRKVVVK